MCPSKILPIKSANLVEFSKKLPGKDYPSIVWKFYTRKKIQFLAFTTDKDEEEITLWWSVDDMFTFDNIGFRYFDKLEIVYSFI